MQPLPILKKKIKCQFWDGKTDKSLGNPVYFFLFYHMPYQSYNTDSIITFIKIEIDVFIQWSIQPTFIENL
jgi:hypothetical protein